MSAVTVPTDPITEFQDKLKQRIRDDIRDLLPDSAVAGLVEKAVNEEFFQPRRVDEDYGRWRMEPSWFVTEIRKAAEPIIRAEVSRFIAENPAAIEKVIAEFLDTNKLTVTATGVLVDMLSGVIHQLSVTMQNLRR